VTPSERTELQDRMRSRTLPAEDVRRARLILLLAQGKSYLAIRQVLGCNPNYISRWKGRFEAERLVGLYSHHRGRAVEKRTPALEARILEWTRRPAPDGSTHWSSRELAQHLGVSHMIVARVWQRAGLKPPSDRTLHGFRRPGLRAQGGRYYWALRQTAPTRGGVLRRREDRHPGPGPARSGPATVAGATRAPRL